MRNLIVATPIIISLALQTGCGDSAATKTAPNMKTNAQANAGKTGGPPEEIAAPANPAVRPKKTTAGPQPSISPDGLISRSALFGNPDKAGARLSPDGAQLAYLAPVEGVLNVWVAPVGDIAAARPVTQDKKRGIRSFFWAFTNKHILYTQDLDGDENSHVYRVDLNGDQTKDLTPIKNVAARVLNVSPKFPEEILVGLNERDPRLHDIYRLNIVRGEMKLVQQNPEFVGFITDDDYAVRFAQQSPPDGSEVLLQPDGSGGWREFLRVPMEDTMNTSAAGFDKSGKVLYMMDSRGRDTGALVSLNLASGQKTTLAENPLADVGEVVAHPTEKTIEAVGFSYERMQWKFLDKTIEADFQFLSTVADGEIDVLDRTLDDKHWIVVFLMDNGPVRYYHYDRQGKKANFLFTDRKELEKLPLAKMHPAVVDARDGLKLVCYLTLPQGSDTPRPGRPEKPLPLVLLVHGGPWARDSWGYNPLHQLLANRGYAVLSVNFRGSIGFGKKFVNAGNKQWAAAMHDDLLDAVAWAVREKIADPKRVAIMGGSYGGYATLVGLTFTPETFACGVDIVGPSNIVTLLKTIPPYWEPAIQMFKDRVGDHTTPEGEKLLLERSPLTHAGKIVRPLLIGQGANDPPVKQSESDQIVKSLQEKKIPVTYVLFPDEGHGFQRPENRMAFFAVAEAFLAQHLGGRFEPIGDSFGGSTITVPSGAEQVPGLKAELELPSK